MNITISCRAIIYQKPHLLVSHQGNIHCLPGGRREKGETLEQGMIREIQEELNFTPRKNTLIGIQELHKKNTMLIDFFYLVGNPEDFSFEKAKKASHVHEFHEMKRVDIYQDSVTILPQEIIEKIKQEAFDEVYSITTILDD